MAIECWSKLNTTVSMQENISPFQNYDGLMDIECWDDLRSYHYVYARENDDGLESSQVRIGQVSSQERENVGSSYPICHMRCGSGQRLVHLQDKVRHHIHCYCKESQPLCNLIHCSPKATQTHNLTCSAERNLEKFHQWDHAKTFF